MCVCWRLLSCSIDDGLRRKPLTCASLGPYGAWLADGSEYTGSYVDTITQEVFYHSVLVPLDAFLKRNCKLM